MDLWTEKRLEEGSAARKPKDHPPPYTSHLFHFPEDSVHPPAIRSELFTPVSRMTISPENWSLGLEFSEGIVILETG